MKRNIIQFVKRAVLLLLAGAAWSCSSKDELEEMLSAETTPVTFLVDAQTTPIFFDYTEGWRYIGSDTVKSTSSQKASLNLRQGKHNIIAVKEIDTNADNQKTGIRFDPNNRAFYLHSERDAKGLDGEISMLGVATTKACYWHRQLEVSPYLLPEQRLEYTPVTASLSVDLFPPNTMPEDTRIIGMQISVKDVPVVEETGMSDNDYKLRQVPHELYGKLSLTGRNEMSRVSNIPYITLCPAEGLHDISLTLNVSVQLLILSQYGTQTYQQHYSVQLPKFSLKRGYTTCLVGTLYSDKTEDWAVEMLPYE